MFDDFDEKGFLQGTVFFIFSIITILIAVPRLIGGIAYSRMVNDGGCTPDGKGAVEIWRYLFTGEFGGCDLVHNAMVLQKQTLAILAVVLAAVLYGWYYASVYGPFGVSDAGGVLEVLGIAVAYLAVAFVVAVAVMVYLAFYAFIFMIGLTALFAMSGSRD